MERHTASYPYRDDVAGAVDHRQALVHEQLPHVFDVSLVGSAEPLALLALQDPDGLQGSSQDHGGQSRGEDEAWGEGAHRVHQGGAAGDVAAHTAKGFTWRNERGQRAWEVRIRAIVYGSYVNPDIWSKTTKRIRIKRMTFES